jgi:hypothetical protein
MSIGAEIFQTPSAPDFAVRHRMVLHKTQELQTWPTRFKS